MEASRFFNILKKQKYTLVLVPVLVMGIAYMLVRKLPDVYAAKGSIAAGILDGSQQGVGLSMDKNLLQETKVNQDFSNLTQMMQMKKVYDQVSYQLIIHDLTNDVPFRPASKLVKSLNEDARKHALEVYSEHYKNHEPLSLWDNDQKGLYKVIASMGYDFDALTKKMRIYRIENSDFVNVEYESDSPKLSAFVVNTLCSEFIVYYTSVTKESERNTIKFLGDLLAQKKDSLGDQVTGLRDFKIRNRVLNLNEQGKSLYGQITEFETRLEILRKDIQADEGALKGINDKFSGSDRRFADKKLIEDNQDVVLIRQQLTSVNDEYIKSNFNPSYKKKMDSLKDAFSEMINRSTDKATVNPQTTKENLIAQKMNMEVNLDLARSSVKSLEDELVKLNRRFDTLVPHEAKIQAYENNINVTGQEYLEILKKYNQTTMAANSASTIKQIEMAMPGPAQPSKKMLLVIMSGLGSFVFCLLILFIVFYIDDSINIAQELANKTDMLVLGYLPLLKNVSLLNLNQLWRGDNETEENRAFKIQLRSIRFEIDNELSGAHMLGVTSLGNGEGKTFLAMSLASACLMINKKVLLIDGNFARPSITEFTKPETYLEDYFTGKASMPRPGYENDITVMGNRGMDTSLFEITNEADIRYKMDALRSAFDIVIIESSSLDTLNLSKEWINVVDKVVAVYESGKSISTAEKNQVAYLGDLKEKFTGWVINKVPGEYIIKKASSQKNGRR